jgi:hypothetical protein
LISLKAKQKIAAMAAPTKTALIFSKSEAKDRGHGRIPARNKLRAFRAARRCATQALLFIHEDDPSHTTALNSPMNRSNSPTGSARAMQ